MLCGFPFTSRDPGVDVRGWAADMLGKRGRAHYTCVCRSANEKSYRIGHVPWDIARPHPALKQLVETGRMSVGTVFEPGPGLGDNALYLASHGFRVTAVDIAPAAVDTLRARAVSMGLGIEVYVGEVVFGLDSVRSGFDYVFERSFLQTLPPVIRPRYVERLERLLKPGGVYVGIIRGPRQPPPVTQPFAFTEAELRSLFSASFEIVELQPTTSGHDDNLDFWLLMARLR